MIRIAWFTGSADGSLSRHVTERLVPILSGAGLLGGKLASTKPDAFDISLFSDDRGMTDLGADHYLNAVARHRRTPFDWFLYQLEDGSAGNPSRLHAGLLPGAVWFHDYLLWTAGPEPILNSPWSETSKRYRAGEGPFPSRDNRYERTSPRALREASYAVAALFSHERSHHEFFTEPAPLCFADERGTIPSYVLPVPVSPDLPSPVRHDSFVIATCGTPNPEHRVPMVLQALEKASAAGESKLLWVLDDSERDAAQDLCAGYPTVTVEFLGPRVPATWAAALDRASAVVHLHYSAFGHVSPYLEMSLMRGVPSLVSRFGGPAHIADTVLYKIDPGDSEAAQIETVLRVLRYGNEPDRRTTRAFAFEHFHEDAVAGELASVFRRHLDRSRAALAGWDRFIRDGGVAVVDEARAVSAESKNPWYAGFERVLAPAMKELGWT